MPASRDSSIGMAIAAAGLSVVALHLDEEALEELRRDAGCGGHVVLLCYAAAATVKSGSVVGTSADGAIRNAELARANWSITLNAFVR